MDADTGRILTSALTGREADDGAQVGPLLDQVAGPVASFVGDGGYDQEGVYAEVGERHPDAAMVVPPRATAVPSDTAENDTGQPVLCQLDSCRKWPLDDALAQPA